MKKSAAQMRKQFLEFHENNPHVLKRIIGMTHELKDEGHSKVGMQMIFEVLRWQAMLRTIANDYKLNNDYAAFYSRLIMETNPDLDGIYMIRKSKIDEES